MQERFKIKLQKFVRKKQLDILKMDVKNSENCNRLPILRSILLQPFPHFKTGFNERLQCDKYGKSNYINTENYILNLTGHKNDFTNLLSISSFLTVECCFYSILYRNLLTKGNSKGIFWWWEG